MHFSCDAVNGCIAAQGNGGVYFLRRLERDVKRIARDIGVCKVDYGRHCFAQAVCWACEHDDGNAAARTGDLKTIGGLVGCAGEIAAENSEINTAPPATSPVP